MQLAKVLMLLHCFAQDIEHSAKQAPSSHVHASRTAAMLQAVRILLAMVL